jgi:hypothetical protein
LHSKAAAVMTLLPIAHAGHWFEGALYLAPVVLLVLVLFFQGKGTEDTEPEPAHGAGSSGRT